MQGVSRCKGWCVWWCVYGNGIILRPQNKMILFFPGVHVKSGEGAGTTLKIVLHTA